MFDRYSDDARQVIFFARYEASLRGSPMLETDHLWLGALRQSKRLVKRLAPHITSEAIQQRLAQTNPAAARVSLTVDIPLSDAVRRVLASDAANADSANTGSQSPVKVDDLILALLREDALKKSA